MVQGDNISKKTYVPFVNAEGPQYLTVIRRQVPLAKTLQLEKAGVFGPIQTEAVNGLSE